MKLVCLGDSQTFCFGLHRGEKWTSILANNTDLEVVNAGLNGDTTSGMLSRLQRDVLDIKPDMVLVMGGGNDYIVGCDITVVKANLMAITQQCLAAGIKVYLGAQPATLPEHVDKHWAVMADFNEVNRKGESMIEWYKRYSKTFGIEFINLGQEFADITGLDPSYYLDGIHQNAKGCEIIAKILEKYFV